jgi:hypothetical protein
MGQDCLALKFVGRRLTAAFDPGQETTMKRTNKAGKGFGIRCCHCDYVHSIGHFGAGFSRHAESLQRNQNIFGSDHADLFRLGRFPSLVKPIRM